MATHTIWWKDGDHDAVTPYRAKSKALDLCPDCGQAFEVHGKIEKTLVHPGDHIITNNDGDIYVEHPDPMAEALS